MVGNRLLRLALVTLSLLLVLPGCRPEDPAFGLGELLADPGADDRAWSTALETAAEKELLEPFARQARELAAERPAAWAPAWIAGEAWSALGRTAEARVDFESGLVRARAAGADVGIAHIANELGWIAYEDGELDAGAEIYGEGVEAAIRAGRQDLEAFLRNNLAGLRVEQGRYASARDELEIAASRLTAIGMEGPATGLSYNRAALEWKLGNLNAAESTLDAVRAAAARLGDSWTLAASDVIRGHIARIRGQTELAAQLYGSVEHEDADVSATAAMGLGRTARDRGDLEAAQAAFRRAAELAATEEPLIATLAEAFHAEGEMEAGRVEAGAAGLSKIIEAADASGDDEAAWVARHLLGRRLSESDPAAARRLLDAAVDRLQATGDTLDALGDGLYLLRGRSQVYVDAALAARDDPARIWQLATWSTGRALRADAAAPRIVTLEEARARLDATEALIVLLAGESRGVALMVGAAGARAAAFAVPSPGKIAELSRSLRQGGAGGGAAIAKALFAPFAGELREIDRLWLVVSGPLVALPFGGLPWEGEHFGTRFAYAVLPTTGVPTTASVGLDGKVLLAGAPLFDDESAARWAPLPFAAREVSRLAAQWGDAATVVTGEALRPDRLQPLDGAGYRLMHFATHARASSLDPRESGLVLSAGEMLGLDRVRAWPLADTTVVLSACSTAEGERVPGQGRLGLVWAFHLAGALEVVASQWAVDDRQTAETMEDLHEALRSGQDATEAMRRVRRIAMEAGDPVSRWAAFEVYRRP